MYDAPTKLALVATILLIGGSALLWDGLYRSRPRPGRRPDPDRLVLFTHGGPRSPAPRRVRPAPPPVRTTPSPASLPSRSPAPPPPPRRYRVRTGDCLSVIAERVYGRSARWPEIAKANDLGPPYTVREGQLLEIP